MKLTQERLKQIIKEELQAVAEDVEDITSTDLPVEMEATPLGEDELNKMSDAMGSFLSSMEPDNFQSFMGSLDRETQNLAMILLAKYQGKEISNMPPFVSEDYV